MKILGFSSCHALLVCSRVPKIDRQGVQNARVKFKEKLNAKLLVKSQELTINI